MKKLIAAAVLLIVALIVLKSVLFTVPEYKQAVKVQLGSPVGGPITQAGLHFKAPLIQDIHLFDKRILEWDGDPEVIPTKDSKFIFVDTFARWRISNALTLYKKVDNEQGAQGRLDDILDGLVRDTLSAHTLLEIVRTSDRQMELGEESLTGPEAEGGQAVGREGQTHVHGLRDELTREITEAAKQRLKELDLGIELVDLEIKRLDYTDKVLRKVYDRMISQQLRIAEKYRALGQGKKAEIAGQVTEESKQIQSEAYKKAQEILGEGDARAARIYAAAYQKDARFYRFVETLQTYRKTLDERGVLILSTDSELYQYLKELK
ncbi:MAG: protease modulator HflC [Acidobacteriota bacterium]